MEKLWFTVVHCQPFNGGPNRFLIIAAIVDMKLADLGKLSAEHWLQRRQHVLSWMNRANAINEWEQMAENLAHHGQFVFAVVVETQAHIVCRQHGFDQLEEIEHPIVEITGK